MARASKPRIRKAAPTVRERAEVAQNKMSNEKPKRVRRLASASARPFKNVRLPDGPLKSGIKKTGRVVGKVLNRLVPRYFVNAWRELRLVTWPSRRETWRLTLAVFIFAIIFGAMVAVVDKGLDEVFKKLVLK